MPKIYGYTEVNGDLLITGSFSILGSASTIDTTTLVVSDPIIALGHSQSGSPTLDQGFMFVRGTGLTQAFIWDETNDNFALIGTNDDHTVVGSINIDSYSSLKVGGLSITTGPSDGYILKSDSSGNASWESPIISDTYTNIQSLQSSDSLKIGTRYYITDRKIWVDAIGGSTFSTSGLRQQTILDSSAYTGSTLGVWYSGLTPAIGDKAIWGGKLWQNVNGLVGTNLDFHDLNSEWNLITSDPLYVEKIFTIEYDFINDRIGSQTDNRGNTVIVNLGYDDYTLITDWGDESIEANITIGIFNNVSNSIYGNILSSYISGNVVGTISRNKGIIIVNNTCSEINGNTFQTISNNNLPSYDISDNIVNTIYNNSNAGDIKSNIGSNIYNNSNNGSIISNITTNILNNSNSGSISTNKGTAIWTNSNSGDIYGNSFETIQFNTSSVLDIIYNKSNQINSNDNTGHIKWNDMGEVSSNSNTGDISYNIGNSLSTNSNTGTISNNVLDNDLINNLNTGVITGNICANIMSNSNSGGIIDNNISGDILSNNNIGDISGNNGSGFISSNDNLGWIKYNHINDGIIMNSNGDDITGNVSHTISNNSNTGVINYNTTTGLLGISSNTSLVNDIDNNFSESIDNN